MRYRHFARHAPALVTALAVMLLIAAPAMAATLYDDLGQRPGLTRIIDQLFLLVLADPRTRGKFDNINIVRLKGRIFDKLCDVAGGPCTYRGISMKGAHRGLGITDYNFNAMVEDLQTAMDRNGIPSWTQNRLLARLAPMHRDIVEP